MINIDGLSVRDEGEATALMIHHLRIACHYFEATHDDRGRYANELIQVMLKKNIIPEGFGNAMSSFIDVMCSAEEYQE